MATHKGRPKKTLSFAQKLYYKFVPFQYRYGAVFRETYRFLMRSQYWSTDKLRAYQLVELKKLIRYAYEQVPYYTRVFKERGLTPDDIQSIDDLKKLPILTKELIRDNFEDLIAIPFKETKNPIFKTSGSTGKKLIFQGHDDMFKKEAAFVLRAFKAQGATLYDKKSIWLRRYVPQTEQDPLWYYDHELRRLFMSAYHLSMQTLPDYLEEMAKDRYHTLVGYPSSIYTLSCFLEEASLSLPSSIKAIHVASEKLLDEWKEKIERVTKLPVKAHYGLIEKVAFFHQTDKSDDYIENLEYGVSEFLDDPHSSDEKIVVGTGFLNYVMPFIRYQTNDTAILNHQETTSSVGLPATVKDFNGRCDDILIAKDGSHIPGVNFYTMMYGIAGVKMFQLIQDTPDTLQCIIVPSAVYTVETDEEIKDGLIKRLGKLSIIIVKQDHIQRNRTTGKIRCIFNNMIRLNASIKHNRHLDTLTPYITPPSASFDNVQNKDWLKLDWNESTCPPSPLVIETLTHYIMQHSVHHYPDVCAAALKEKLSSYIGCHAANIEVFNGSDSALKIICETFLDETKSCIVFEPTYHQIKPFIQTHTPHIRYSAVKDPLGDHTYSFDDIKDATVAYIVNPSNPTGYQLPLEDVEALLKKYPDTLFIIDEAYGEYSGITSASLTLTYENIIVTRTFSKAFGLAGLRLGYCMAHPSVLNYIRKIRNGKDVNALAQIGGQAALDDVAYMKHYVAQVNFAKQRTITELRALGYECFESEGNFFLMKVKDVSHFINYLKSQKILIRDRSMLPGLDHCVRISVGTYDIMEKLILKIKEYRYD